MNVPWHKLMPAHPAEQVRMGAGETQPVGRLLLLCNSAGQASEGRHPPSFEIHKSWQDEIV